MEKLSRVKKYEDLRKNIESQSGNEVASNKLTSYANRLNDIDPVIFKKMEISDDDTYKPERERRDSYFKEEIESPISNFKNEYLDDFINEVREYNIRKGTREDMDTQIDILHQLHNVKREKRAHYVEEIQEDDTSTLSQSEIAMQIHNLLREEDEEESSRAVIDNIRPFSIGEPAVVKKKEVLEDIITPNAIADDIEIVEEEPVVNQTVALHTIRNPSEYEDEAKLHHKFVEETQQLRVQMSEYEGELTDLNEGLDKTNKTLNVILSLLILSLIVIIGLIVFYLFKNGGTL